MRNKRVFDPGKAGFIFCLAAAVSLFWAAGLFCAEITGMVIGRDNESREIWVDIGTGGGIKEGDFLDVFHDGKKVSVLRVSKVFDSFSITRTVYENDYESVQEMDKVKFDSSLRVPGAVSPQPKKSSSGSEMDTLHEKIELSQANLENQEIKYLKSELARFKKQLQEKDSLLELSEGKLASLQSELRRKDEANKRMLAILAEVKGQLASFKGAERGAAAN